MSGPEFTDDELAELAGFVCERYDGLISIANDPNPRIRGEYRDGAARAARMIEQVSEKLRPYYRGGTR